MKPRKSQDSPRNYKTPLRILWKIKKCSPAFSCEQKITVQRLGSLSFLLKHKIFSEFYGSKTFMNFQLALRNFHKIRDYPWLRSKILFQIPQVSNAATKLINAAWELDQTVWKLNVCFPTKWIKLRWTKAKKIKVGGCDDRFYIRPGW